MEPMTFQKQKNMPNGPQASFLCSDELNEGPFSHRKLAC